MIINQNCNFEIKNLFKEFENNQKPIEVNFRELVDWIPYKNRGTHFIHPYPAKLLMHIPHFFLNNEILSKREDLILDPFCGSGTTLLESLLSSRNSVGFDVNPLAVLISKVKTSKLSENKLKKLVKKITSKLRVFDSLDVPNVLNIDYWYDKKTILELSSIKRIIDAEEDDRYKDWLKVCFSILVQKKSLSDPNVSVPVKLNPDKKSKSKTRRKLELDLIKRIKEENTFELYISILNKSILQIRELNQMLAIHNDVKVFQQQINNLEYSLKNSYKNKFQLVITSPPYAGAQKYIRSSSLSLGWLEMDKEKKIVQLKRESIGREVYRNYEVNNIGNTGIKEANQFVQKIENINPTRAKIISNYLQEMREALKNVYNLAKPGGYFVLIMGNNEVCGHSFNTQKYISEISEGLGFNKKLTLIDVIKSRGLMTKRNKSASLITREWVHVFEK